MFFYDHRNSRMYHITRKSAQDGLLKIVTSRVKKRFNSELCEKIIKDIIDNLAIPNEYANDKCIYMSVDESDFEGIRFSITASEVIKCKNPENGNELVPLPFPKCKEKADYSNYLTLNSVTILSELARDYIEDGVIKQSGNFANMKFSLSNSYTEEIAKSLRRIFSPDFQTKVAKNIICNATVECKNRFFVYRINNRKPAIYEVSRNSQKAINLEEHLSATKIRELILLYTKGLTCIDTEISWVANLIHNKVLYDEYYLEEELNNPYTYEYDVLRKNSRFRFKKTVEGIEFILRYSSLRWVSHYICVPFKEIEWENIVDLAEYHTPKYKGFYFASPEDEYLLKKVVDENKIRMYAATKAYIYSSKNEIHIRNEKITEDTFVYFRLVLTKNI
ncbi:MAG: hypothetical protein K6B70_02145 [Clostridia bacterium]|nr:hypothetical protein [Clostridia bacterium]